MTTQEITLTDAEREQLIETIHQANRSVTFAAVEAIVAARMAQAARRIREIAAEPPNPHEYDAGEMGALLTGLHVAADEIDPQP